MDLDATAEWLWRRVSYNRFNAVPVTKTEMVNWVIRHVGLYRNQDLRTYCAMKYMSIKYGDCVQRSFKRLVAAGVIFYEPRRPLAAAI